MNQQASSLTDLFDTLCTSAIDLEIANKIFYGTRILEGEALYLYESDNLPLLKALSSFVREQKHSRQTFFNHNFHIEPTNICVFECAFCSFSRKLGEEGSWETSLDEVKKIAESYRGKSATEVHIVGGVHPKRGVDYYSQMIRIIKEVLPHIHVKGFTAVELEVMFKRSRLSVDEGLKLLKEAGLDSIPGGGAEIFDPEVRTQICATKATADTWLNIHETAHKLGIPSNCTMLYGHIESYKHRVHHMSCLRELQDRTHGFNTFIPLKFRHENNNLSHVQEVSEHEDLKNYAVARLFLDNIPHLKAYWPMIGRETAALSLSYGVDDLDGTIDDSTKIYSMAGAEDQNPAMSSDQLCSLIRSAGFEPAERDSIYNKIVS